MIKRNSPYIILSFIILLGICLRVYNLSSQSIWYDEAQSIAVSGAKLSYISTRTYHTPPFYFILLKCWTGLFGKSEFAVRFLSVIFGALSILLIYKVGRDLLDRKVGLYSAFILSVSMFHIYYSQEARSYSLFVFLTILSMLLFIKIMKKNKTKTFVFYIIVNSLLVFTHILGLFVLVFQNLYYFFFIRRRNIVKWLTIQSIILLTLLPWAIIQIGHLQQMPDIGDRTAWIAKTDLSALAKTFVVFGSGAAGKYMKNTMSIWLFWIYNSTLFLLSLRGLMLLKKKKGWLLLLWLGFPIVTLFFFSVMFFPVYVTRYAIFASAAYYIFAAKGLSSIKTKYIKNCLILLIIIFTVSSLRTYYNKDSKIPWRHMVAYMGDNTQLGDITIIAPIAQKMLFAYYADLPLYIMNNKTSRMNLIDTYYKWGIKTRAVNDLFDLKNLFDEEDLAAHKNNLRLVVTHWVKDPEPMLNYIENFYIQKERQDFYHASIYYYTPKPR